MNFSLDMDMERLEACTGKCFSFDPVRFEEICGKAYENVPLDLDDIAFLSSISDPEGVARLFYAANEVKEAFHGRKVSFFAPLYLSNECVNNCLYCGFRTGNNTARRTTLSLEEIIREAGLLYNQGHGNILLVTAENPEKVSPSFVCEAISVIKEKYPSLATVNLNYPPVSFEDFMLFANSRMDGFQSFQETYHPQTYIKAHLSGMKSRYENRLDTFDRACAAGVRELGAGVLWGLYDYRFELLAMTHHIYYLEKKYDILPGTISVPRLRPAENNDMNDITPFMVDDETFCRIIAVYRLAFPRWDIAVSTRETASMRLKCLSLGTSMLSAGSTTTPGGYSRKTGLTRQFELEDSRSLAEVMKSVHEAGMISGSGSDRNRVMEMMLRN